MKIGFKFIILILLMAFFLLIGGLSVARLGRNALEHQIVAESVAVTSNHADLIDRAIYENYADFKLLSESHTPMHFLTELRDSGTMNAHPKASVFEDFYKFQETYPNWYDLMLINTDRNVVVATSSKETGTIVTADYLDAVLSGNPFLSDFQLGQDTTSPHLVFALPIFEFRLEHSHVASPVVGALIGKLSWKEVTDIIDSVDPVTSDLHLFDADGMLLSTNEDDKTGLFKEYIDLNLLRHLESGNMKAMRVEGKDDLPLFLAHFSLSGFKEYHGHGWFLVSQNEEAVLFAPIALMEQRSYLYLIVLLFVALLVGGYLSWQVYTSLKWLTTAVTEYGQGNMNNQIDKNLLSRKDEFGVLARTFDVMRMKLAASIAGIQREKKSLSQKVAVRTKELEAAKADLEKHVQKRTAELQKLNAELEAEVDRRTEELAAKVTDLERFNEISVGRELKMLELKKKIARLEEQLKKK